MSQSRYDVNWISNVPKGWSVMQLGHAASADDDSLNENLNGLREFCYVDISAVDHIAGIMSSSRVAAADAPSRARRLAKEGDVLVSTVRTYLKAIAEVTREYAECVFSTGFAVLRGRTERIESAYLKWMLLNEGLIQAIEAHSEGLSYPAINTSALMKLKVVVPPMPDQRRIAVHLKRATSRIDTLVAKKTRFIELLREKRQALITHAVTKGLDPNVPMKDSGVEWLGRLPAHWAIKRLKRVAMIENSGCYGADEHSDQATVRIKTCTTAHISADSRFLFESMEERFFSPAEASRYAGAPGDIFVVKSSGSNTNIISGKLARIDRNHPSVVFTNFLMRVRPNKIHVEPEFLEYFLSSTITRRRIERMVATTTYPNINVSEYASALIPIPTLEEQRSITTTINKKVSRIATLIAKTERSIELLREHRTALITAAVTGKIDLRDAD